MLDLTVAMLKLLLAILLFFQDSPAAIASPKSGETLRGQVNITGNINITGFGSAELAFAYASDPTSTWFTIQTFSSPPATGEAGELSDVLVAWDTTMLTDGEYTLRLRVNLQDGSVQEVLVTDLEISNDVPTATLTSTLEPEATLVPPLPTATVAPAAALPTYPTPTSLPVNPATLANQSIYSNFARGTAATLILFFLVAIILRLRRS